MVGADCCSQSLMIYWWRGVGAPGAPPPTLRISLGWLAQAWLHRTNLTVDLTCNHWILVLHLTLQTFVDIDLIDEFQGVHWHTAEQPVTG